LLSHWESHLARPSYSGSTLIGARRKRLQPGKTFTPEELVDRFPLFAGLTPEQREVLVLHFGTRTAEPGERIIRAGDKADSTKALLNLNHPSVR
jgi:hypothetical protein